MNNLMISEEERLKVKVEKLEIDQSQYESLRDEFERFKAELLNRK
jgi:hypothetical protein